MSSKLYSKAGTDTLARRSLDVTGLLRVDGEKPTVTVTTSATTIASGTDYTGTITGSVMNTSTSPFYVGGVPSPLPVNAGVRFRATLIPNGDASTRYVPVFKFTTSASAFEYQGLTPGANFLYSLTVDGKLAIPDGMATTNGGDYIYARFDFGTARPRVIELSVLDPDIYCFRAPTGYTIAKSAQGFGPALWIEGDSMSAGAGVASGGVDRNRAFGVDLARALGFDHCINDAVGGTGWVNAGSTSTFPTRLTSNVVPKIGAQDTLLIVGSRNDSAGSAAAVTTAVSSALPALVAACRKVVVAGTFTNLAINNAVKTGAAAAGVTFLDVSDFYTGTGKVGTPTYDGNSDRYITTDGVHQTPRGVEFAARQLARMMAAVAPVPIAL